MRRLGLALQRLFVVFAGYVAACLAASFGLHVALFATGRVGPEMLPLIAAGSFIFSIPFAAVFVAYFAFPPSLAVLVLAELLAWRRASVYALLGALVGAAICLMIWQAGQPPPLVEPPLPSDGPLGWGLGLTLVASGALAGLAYWLVAGQFTRQGAERVSPAAG